MIQHFGGPLTPDHLKFANLGQPRRLWAVAAVHGDVVRLCALHDHILTAFRPGDRLVYLGNFLGRGGAIAETVEELMRFRRVLLSLPGMITDDIVFLRGQQEEMWQKLLQLQFAPNPQDVLRWMLSQGVEPTLRAYGATAQEGLVAARTGAVHLTRWTNRLRETMRRSPGHNSLFAALKRAAMAYGADGQGGVLAVSAGLDPARPLGAQGDSFWWGHAAFAAMAEPFDPFDLVVRGYDPDDGGIHLDGVAITLDGGCGRGGHLVAARIDPDAGIQEILEA